MPGFDHFNEIIFEINGYNTPLRGTFKLVMKNILTLILTLVVSQLAAQRHDNPSHYLKSLGRKLPVFLRAADFQNGDHVADIGAANGWFDAAIGIYEDSLSFTLEDIDSSFVKKSRLSEALAAYAEVKGSPITCSYFQTIGTEEGTQLPEDKFDKVILIDTYHHLRYRDEMIADINRILRPGGRLIVYEPVGKKKGEIFKACNSLLYTSEEIISAFRDYKFHFENSFEAAKTSGKRARVFVFVKL